MTVSRRFPLLAFAALGASLTAACATHPPTPASTVGAPTRPHDQRHFTVDAAELPFAAIADSSAVSDRWWGVENGAGYRIEVPRNWNGRLVMYAHGYRGNGEVLTPASPRFRRELIEAGYAWAASTYSANDYDVRAGIEDTNALALAFTRIAANNGRQLPAPNRLYIIGHSMGGHIAAAAVEAETLAKAHNKVHYAGSMPMCGVLGDLELYDYFVAYSLAAEQLSGVGPVAFPAVNWAERAPRIIGTLFSSFPTPAAPTTPVVAHDTPAARELKAIVMNLSGGPRPVFEEGFARSSNGSAWSTFGLTRDGGGILLNGPETTEHTVYRFADGARPSPEELAFNREIPRALPEANANPPRSDGLRWVPPVTGEVHVPVLTLHNLGDLFVPFHMEQIYHRRVADRGNSRWLVQRAIRSPLHCDFTAAEESTAFTALVGWVEQGRRPAGDDVVTRAVVADSAYGCAFTDNTTGPEDPGEAEVRAAMPACPAH